MPTGVQDAHRRIKDLFNTGWGSTTEIAWGNVRFRPAEDSTLANTITEWVRLAVEHRRSEQIGMGAVGRRLTRYEGNVTVEIFTALHTSEDRATALVDIVRGIFEGVTDNGIFYRTTLPMEIGNAGGWYQVNAQTPFQWDIQI